MRERASSSNGVGLAPSHHVSHTVVTVTNMSIHSRFGMVYGRRSILPQHLRPNRSRCGSSASENKSHYARFCWFHDLTYNQSSSNNMSGSAEVSRCTAVCAMPYGQTEGLLVVQQMACARKQDSLLCDPPWPRWINCTPVCVLQFLCTHRVCAEIFHLCRQYLAAISL